MTHLSIISHKIGHKALRSLLPVLHLLLLTLIGCTNEEILLSGSDKVIEGQKTTLLLSFKNIDPIQVSTRASLPEATEKAMNSIAIYIFDESGQIVSSTFHVNTRAHVCDVNGNPVDEPLSPDGLNYFPVETLTGNNHKIYAIACYESNVIENLKSVSTEAQFKELIIQVVANPLDREFGMTKVGGITTNVRPLGQINIDMSYVSAKISLNVINNYDKFQVEGWTVDNVPTKSYVWQRTPDFANDPNYHDATDISNEEDYYHDFADQRFEFEAKPSGITGTFSSVFYMTENRRGGRVVRNAPADGETREEYQLKSWYAPTGATYIKVYGTLTDASGNKQRITIKHYLGSNNTDDYNVSRATNYTYNITITSLGKIKIDTNVESNAARLRVDPPADAMSLDGHYGFRLFRVHSQEITSADYTVSAEVVQAVNSVIPAQWLNVAIVPITMHHIKRSGDPWQQDGGADGSYVRPKFIPNKATREVLQYEGKPYVAPLGITFPSDPDYPNDDTSLPFSKVAYRMCKKITELPTNNTHALTQPFNVMVYADEYPFDNSPLAPAYREAVIRFTLQKDGIDVEYVHFSIRQYPPYRFMRAPGSTEVLLVERVEEFEHMLMPSMPLNFQMLAGMQWGEYKLPNANNNQNGRPNTLLGVYTDTIAAHHAGNYLPKYGSLSGNWSKTNNGKIVEPATAVYTGLYNLPAVTDPNHVNIIYNTTAARYCHEKNWDRNGNGNIDIEETLWYLPSTVELQQFWTLHELINTRPDFYWSSEQADDNNAYALSMLSSPADAHLTYSGVRQSIAKVHKVGTNPPRVRCVRRIKNINPLMPLVIKRADNSIVIDCSNLPGTILTNQSKLGITQGDPTALYQANEKIFKTFEVSRTQNPTTDYYTLHFGNGLCDQTKGWRLPTQREMLLIWSVRTELEAFSTSGFANFVNDQYWTMNRDLRSRYTVDFATGLAKYEAFQGLSIQHQYRCIREIQ